MAGTDDTVADDDALFVLTAVLLTPAQFPSALGDDYVAACAALGLEPYAEGYGLVLGQDSGGARWTVVVEDVSLVAVAIASWDCGMEYDLSPDDRSVVCALPGWPLALAVCAPGVPEPHDPVPDPEAEGGGGPVPLTPPDTEVWGAPQRRLGADEIALQWAEWRGQIDDETAFGTPGERAPEGGSQDYGTGTDEDRTAGSSPESAGSGQHPGVRRALEAARAYVTSPPPPGRIRSAFAPGGARTLRADGPGWSLVARTDDIAFVLLDEEPGEIMPVGRGPELPGLLKSLDELAVRPS
ncbi:hypothetical protein [Streptomyces sp. NPDC053728]|uniref:hypothetical protein n=1 Tax=Streptomyces sp. NPDC053728 TaxID=3155534 RepID=UPI003420FEBF